MPLSRDPQRLEPSVRARLQALRRLASQRGLSFILTSTLRTAPEQEALYAQGRRPLQEVNALRARAGLEPITEAENRIVTWTKVSMHQFGLAFDVALLDEGGRPHWELAKDTNGNGRPDYLELGELGEAAGLQWGGRFSSPDYCHFQYTGGLSLQELLQGRRPGEPSPAEGPPQGAAPEPRARTITHFIRRFLACFPLRP
jgi:peptidoglycan L-alanyl-D-glutamate endopeptidase CwlK